MHTLHDVTITDEPYTATFNVIYTHIWKSSLTSCADSPQRSLSLSHRLIPLFYFQFLYDTLSYLLRTAATAARVCVTLAHFFSFSMLPHDCAGLLSFAFDESEREWVRCASALHGYAHHSLVAAAAAAARLHSTYTCGKK